MQGKINTNAYFLISNPCNTLTTKNKTHEIIGIANDTIGNPHAKNFR